MHPTLRVPWNVVHAAVAKQCIDGITVTALDLPVPVLTAAAASVAGTYVRIGVTTTADLTAILEHCRLLL